MLGTRPVQARARGAHVSTPARAVSTPIALASDSRNPSQTPVAHGPSEERSYADSCCQYPFRAGGQRRAVRVSTPWLTGRHYPMTGPCPRLAPTNGRSASGPAPPASHPACPGSRAIRDPACQGHAYRLPRVASVRQPSRPAGTAPGQAPSSYRSLARGFGDQATSRRASVQRAGSSRPTAKASVDGSVRCDELLASACGRPPSRFRRPVERQAVRASPPDRWRLAVRESSSELAAGQQEGRRAGSLKPSASVQHSQRAACPMLPQHGTAQRATAGVRAAVSPGPLPASPGYGCDRPWVIGIRPDQARGRWAHVSTPPAARAVSTPTSPASVSRHSSQFPVAHRPSAAR